jgi:hypothetical protein
MLREKRLQLNVSDGKAEITYIKLHGTSLRPAEIVHRTVNCRVPNDRRPTALQQ